MKKFILNIFVFLLILFVGSCILDFLITQGLKRMSDYRFKTWTDFFDKPVDADLVVNGNSRAFSHYVPNVMDSVLGIRSYNLGVGGSPFETEYLKYKFYLQYNQKPKFIIQNVDFVTLANVDYIGHEREQFFPYVFTPYMRKHLGQYGFEKKELYLPLVRYFGHQQEIKEGLMSFFHLMHKHRRSVDHGFSPETGNWNPSELNKLNHLSFAHDKRSCIMFENYLKECERDNIMVFLVNSPVFYRATVKLQDRNEMKRYFETMASKYHAVYLDYTNDSICYDSTNFVVAVHMNEKAARRFSKELAERIKSILQK